MARALSRGLLVPLALLVAGCGSTPGADTAVLDTTPRTRIPSTERAAIPTIVSPPGIVPTGRETPTPTVIAPAFPEPTATPRPAKPTKAPKPTEPVAACPTHDVVANGYNGAEFGSSGIMANGKRVHWGAVAVDPRYIPLGTRIHISGFGK